MTVCPHQGQLVQVLVLWLGYGLIRLAFAVQLQGVSQAMIVLPDSPAEISDPMKPVLVVPHLLFGDDAGIHDSGISTVSVLGESASPSSLLAVLTFKLSVPSRSGMEAMLPSDSLGRSIESFGL